MIVVQNIFLSLMILSSVYFSYLDIKTQKIPRLFSYLFLGFCILGGFFVIQQPINTIFTGFLGFGLFFLVRKITKNKLGLADCFFSSGIGFFFGFRIWIAISFLACGTALIKFIQFFIAKQILKDTNRCNDYAEKMKAFIPFIPCLSFGVVVFSVIWLM
ncbi:MAG: prepilin peptidase [Spirochaetaceae bacterium]|nr:prepilin peptidase [Spirochaetaceae bacterium]